MKKKQCNETAEKQNLPRQGGQGKLNANGGVGTEHSKGTVNSLCRKNSL